MPEIPKTFVDAAFIVSAVATIVLALVTYNLAKATRGLVDSARDESRHIAAQAAATAALATATNDRLEEDRAEAHRLAHPGLIWELADPEQPEVPARELEHNPELVYLTLAARLANHGGDASLAPVIQITNSMYSVRLAQPHFQLPSFLARGQSARVHLVIDSPRRNADVDMRITLTARGAGTRFEDPVIAEAEFAISTMRRPDQTAFYSATVRQAGSH